MVAAWSFLTVEEADQQFGGNLGYEDVLGERYLWNNTVPNYRAVQPGDLVVLRDKTWVLGLAWVDDIAQGPGKKVLRRCPQCTATSIKRRTTKTPTFKCSGCGAEFDTPVTNVLDVTVFEADYARTWRPLDPLVRVQQIQGLFLNRSGQQSIRPMDLEGIRAALTGSAGAGPLWWKEDGGLRPPIPGGHTLILHKARVGQQQFRQRMLERYGSRCAITGDQPEEVLEAAHLYRYATTPHHDPNGGLLLRRDLHALLDRGLLTIDTTTWTVQLAPRLRNPKYADFAPLHGQPLKLPTSKRPDSSYLDEHHKIATEAWAV
ncbi:HNH endonuclease [Actinomadura luteofluorescens]|uniref:HNH nuclease domain-containing protein n=1 Tax=Actinomadura luteofluorescens TaxID=46163 RepID=A0A7Y9EQC3_9ACTN|nr:HNH endonuclease signature motif containing protein [Actinomadura luteofluorescens]NYD52023.1 hypothetical protein [Actinomadura luteofluorescens]